MIDVLGFRTLCVGMVFGVGAFSVLPSQVPASDSVAGGHSVIVVVTDAFGHEPGIPIEVRFRTESTVVLRANTDRKGYVTVLIPKNLETQIREVEAIFPVSTKRYLATAESYDSDRDAYCLDLPRFKTDCLNWVEMRGKP